MADRMEKYNPTEAFDAGLQAMSYRLDALEREHNDLLVELRTKVLRPVEPPPPVADILPDPSSGYASEAVDAFAPTTPHGFAFDIPQENPDPFAPPPEFADVFADAPEPENFLAQARRSARAASEKAESERRGRFSAFRWGKDAATEGEEKAKPRYLLPALVAMLVVVAAAAALVLSQHAKQPDVAAAPTTHPATTPGPTYSVPSPPDSNDTQFVVAPQAGAQP